MARPARAAAGQGRAERQAVRTAAGPARGAARAVQAREATDPSAQDPRPERPLAAAPAPPAGVDCRRPAPLRRAGRRQPGGRRAVRAGEDATELLTGSRPTSSPSAPRRAVPAGSCARTERGAGARRSAATGYGRHGPTRRARRADQSRRSDFIHPQFMCGATFLFLAARVCIGSGERFRNLSHPFRRRHNLSESTPVSAGEIDTRGRQPRRTGTPCVPRFQGARQEMHRSTLPRPPYRRPPRRRVARITGPRRDVRTGTGCETDNPAGAEDRDRAR